MIDKYQIKNKKKLYISFHFISFHFNQIKENINHNILYFYKLFSSSEYIYLFNLSFYLKKISTNIDILFFLYVINSYNRSFNDYL